MPERVRAECFTDDAGYFRFHASPNSYLCTVVNYSCRDPRRLLRLSPRESVYRSLRVDPVGTPGPPRRADRPNYLNLLPEPITLPGGAELTGHASGGQPFPQAILFYSTGEIASLTLADAEGRYRFTNLPAGDYCLAAGEIDLWGDEDPQPMFERALPVTLIDDGRHILHLQAAE